MKPTEQDEIMACLVQLNADIETISDALDYIQPVQARLSALLERVQNKTA